MPFYLRGHAGPIGYSHRIGGGRRSPQRQSGGGAWLVVLIVAILLLYVIIRWWYVAVPVIAVIALPFVIAAAINARARGSEAAGKQPASTSAPPRYVVCAWKAGEDQFSSSGLTGPEAEKLVAELKKDGWRPEVLLLPRGPR